MSSRLAAETLAALDRQAKAQAQAQAQAQAGLEVEEVVAWTSLVTEVDPSSSVFGFAPAPAPAPSPSPSGTELAVRDRISSLTALNASSGATALPPGQRDEVQLTICGMASIYLALRIALLAEEQARSAAAAAPKVQRNALLLSLT